MQRPGGLPPTPGCSSAAIPGLYSDDQQLRRRGCRGRLAINSRATANNMNTNPVKINDIVNIYNSYITILAKLKNEANGYGIVFHDPIQNKIIQLLDKNFAFLYKQIVSDFALGFATGSIVGLARERTPADQWHSDTIERNVHDKNSLHQGILRIVDKEDGIPVYINSIKIVGNISPALAYSLKGNPTEIQTILNKYKLIQKHIMEKISEGKPEVNPEALLRTYCAGEGFKSESRLHSINRALSNLTASTDKQ